MTKPSSDARDVELVALTRAGHREAFSELVRRYHEPIVRTAYTLVGNADDAADLAQEIFLKAYRSLSGFRVESQFYTWLYRIGVNCCLDWKKSRYRRKDLWLRNGEWERQDGSGAVLCDPEAPDAAVLRRELQDTLKQALESLSLEYRHILILREVEGLPHKKIAYALDCSEGTVKSRLFRAKRRLRKVLKYAYKDWCTA